MRGRVLAVLVVLALAGCEAAPTASQRSTAVSLAADRDGRFIVLAGPIMRHAPPFLGVPSTNFYLLRSFVDTRRGGTAHQLYVEDSYPGAERAWNAARLATGEPLRFIPISKNEITCDAGCSYAEEFAAALPEPLLRASPAGFTVLFTARSGGRKAIAVPANLISKQLAALDQVHAAAGLSNPSPAP